MIGAVGIACTVPIIEFFVTVTGFIPVFTHRNGIVPERTTAMQGATDKSSMSGLLMGVMIISVPSGKSVWATAIVSCIGCIVNLLSAVAEWW